MPFNSYDELIETVGVWLGRDDLQAEICDFILLAERRSQRELKLQPTGAETSGLSLTTGQNYIAAPADCLEFRHLEFDTSPVRYTRPVSLDRIANINEQSNDSIPFVHCLHGSKIFLAPTPDADTDYTLFYLSGISRLTEDNTTNWLLVNAPDLLLFGALSYAGAYKSAEDMQTYMGMFQDAVQSVQKQEWRSRVGGQPLRQQADQVA